MFAAGIRIATRDHPQSRLDSLISRMTIQVSGFVGECYRPEFALPPNEMSWHVHLPLRGVMQLRQRTFLGDLHFQAKAAAPQPGRAEPA